MPPTATESHQRVRLQRAPGWLVLHATVIPGTFDVSTGAFQASFDVDPKGTAPTSFTVAPDSTKGIYLDGANNLWTLIN